MSFENTPLVARYERRLIIRNKLFWIFASCVIIGITLSHWIWQGEGLGSSRWLNRALPSFIPFWNAWFYNLLQGIIVIFIGIDFVWRDRRLETNAVFSARPVTNLAYQTGKVLGIVEVCLTLNLITMALGMIFHLLFGEPGTFQLKIYLVYLFLLTLPTLSFILGIALIVANRVKNHALALLILLSLFAAFYFGAADLLWGTVDPWGRVQPLLFSDVTGITRPAWLILQRGMFLLLGLGLITLATGMMPRLSERPATLWKVRAGGGALILLGLVLGGTYYAQFHEINSRRATYRDIFQKYVDIKGTRVKTHDIYFRQEGNKMIGESTLLLANEGPQPLPTPVLYLNLGLRVTALRGHDGEELPYHRESQAIILQTPLSPGEETLVRLTYEGPIDEAVCFPDFTDEEFHDTRLRCFFRGYDLRFRHGRCFVRVGDNYTLLFPECLWYPVAIPPVNVNTPLARQYDFTRYRLKVGNVGQRVAISQGEMTTNGDTAIFTNHQPLPSLTLAIGAYERETIVLDSLTLELYYFPGHDFFTRDYTCLKDSARLLLEDPVSQIREIKGGDYPYRKFTLVETPANFVPHSRKGLTGSEFVQPEIQFYPENMYLGYYMHVGFWPGSEDERTRFELEMEELRNVLVINLLAGVFDCSAQFGDFMGVLQSDQYPGFGAIVNDLAKVDFFNGPMVYIGEEVSDSEIITYWQEKSMREAFADREVEGDRLQTLLRTKYRLIQKHLQALVGERELFHFMKQFKQNHLFAYPPFEQLEREFNARFRVNLREILDYYYDSKELPALFLRDMKVELYEEGEEAKNIGSCKIYNPTSSPAVVTLSVATYSMGDNEHGSGLRNYLIPGHTCKEIRADLGTRNMFALEMNLCQNLPGERTLEWTSSENIPKTRDAKTGIWDTDSALFTREEPGIVVTAEDPGFSIHEKNRKGKLAAYLSTEQHGKKYHYIYDHDRWTLVLDPQCYGDIVKSAYYKMAGTGKSQVEWKVNVETPGKYEVFAYLPDVEATSARKVFIGGARLFYRVTSADDITDVELFLDDEQPGWISLGVFNFDRGEYSVFLSDRGGDSLSRENSDTRGWDGESVQFIFANAVKWVPVK